MVPRYLTLVWLILACTPHPTPTWQSTCQSPCTKHVMGPTALTIWCHHISTSRLCYTLVWLSLTNTPRACHFSVVYNVRIAGVFIHSSICFSHFPIINCTHSFVAHCQYIAYHIHKVNPVVYRIFLHAVFINMPVCMSSLTYLLPLNYAPCRSHGGPPMLQRCVPLSIHLHTSPPVCLSVQPSFNLI